MKWLYNSGYRATKYYDIALYFRQKKMLKVSNLILVLCKRSTGTEFSPNCKIGKNLQIAHGQDIVIGGDTIVGNNCIIYNGVTIGVSGKLIKKDGLLQQEKLYPKIGNNCIIYTGAKVLGNISVGDNVIIGANSVVLNDIPNSVIVAGIPAKLIKTHNYSLDQLR